MGYLTSFVIPSPLQSSVLARSNEEKNRPASRKSLLCLKKKTGTANTGRCSNSRPGWCTAQVADVAVELPVGRSPPATAVDDTWSIGTSYVKISLCRPSYEHMARVSVTSSSASAPTPVVRTRGRFTNSGKGLLQHFEGVIVCDGHFSGTNAWPLSDMQQVALILWRCAINELSLSRRARGRGGGGTGGRAADGHHKRSFGTFDKVSVRPLAWLCPLLHHLPRGQQVFACNLAELHVHIHPGRCSSCPRSHERFRALHYSFSNYVVYSLRTAYNQPIPLSSELIFSIPALVLLYCSKTALLPKTTPVEALCLCYYSEAASEPNGSYIINSGLLSL